MDIVCPKCCEPFELDTIHDYVSEFRDMFPEIAETVSFRSVYRSFVSDGCGVALEAWKVSCNPDKSGRGALLGELAYLLGDDVDGYAATCEDLDGLGVL